MRSPLVIMVPLAVVAVHCSGRFCMRVSMCVSVLLSAWVRCAYVVWVYGVFVGLVGVGVLVVSAPEVCYWEGARLEWWMRVWVWALVWVSRE